MTMQSTPMRPRLVTKLVAAASASVIAIGILAAVADLLQRDGMPLEQLVVAERACVEYAYVSERNACIRQWLAGSRLPRLAGLAPSAVAAQ